MKVLFGLQHERRLIAHILIRLKEYPYHWCDGHWGLNTCVKCGGEARKEKRLYLLWERIKFTNHVSPTSE